MEMVKGALFPGVDTHTHPFPIFTGAKVVHPLAYARKMAYGR